MRGRCYVELRHVILLVIIYTTRAPGWELNLLPIRVSFTRKCDIIYDLIFIILIYFNARNKSRS